MVLLVGFIATTAYTKFNKRRENDMQEWKVENESAFSVEAINALWQKASDKYLRQQK